MGTCATTGQYYPILNTYLGQLEINVSGFPQGTEIPDLFVFFNAMLDAYGGKVHGYNLTRIDKR